MSSTIISFPLDNFILLATFALLIIPIIFITFLKRRNKQQCDGVRLAPSPPTLPIIGNLHQLGKLPHRSLWELSLRYGPVMMLRLGDVPVLVVSSAEMAKEVLKTHDVDTCSRPASPGTGRLSYDYLDVAFSPYTEYWREVRKLFMFEMMSTKRVHSLWHVREAEVDALIGFLRKNAGNAVEMNERIFALTDGIVGTVAFGKMYGRDKFGSKSFQCVLDEAMNMLARFSAEEVFPRWGRTIDRLTGLTSRLEKIIKDLDKYYEYVIEEHRKPSRDNEQEIGDFVDVLLNLQSDPKNKLALTDNHIKAILMDTFIGAISTSSITMLWAMSELVRNPRVLKKAQDEIRNRIGKKPRVESDDMAKLPYLRMVVKETLRLHPPLALLLPRETIRPCKIGGYDVPARTRVFVNAWGIGRDPRSWERPEKFDPDRFEVLERDFKGQDFELIPFGSGRRTCPGMTMGVTTIEFTLANLLYGFDWKLPEGTKVEDFSMEEEGGLAIYRKMPLRLVPTKYN
uniref:CYP71E76 n=1 Tax=Miconia microphysca TaxID=3021300 RepID=A0AA50KJP0_9MYRT|nr:CYP71E76 [Miconia microphysca]